jgi:hypothetical protein
MSKFARENAVVPFTPAADQSEKRGYLVALAGDTATLSASATVPAKGVILDGEDTDGQSSIGILGTINGTVRMKSSGVITKGDFVAQHTDGRIKTDPAAGARVIVGVALESGVEDELIEVAPITPQTLA